MTTALLLIIVALLVLILRTLRVHAANYAKVSVAESERWHIERREARLSKGEAG